MLNRSATGGGPLWGPDGNGRRPFSQAADNTCLGMCQTVLLQAAASGASSPELSDEGAFPAPELDDVVPIAEAQLLRAAKAGCSGMLFIHRSPLSLGIPDAHVVELRADMSTLPDGHPMSLPKLAEATCSFTPEVGAGIDGVFEALAEQGFQCFYTGTEGGVESGVHNYYVAWLSEAEDAVLERFREMGSAAWDAYESGIDVEDIVASC